MELRQVITISGLFLLGLAALLKWYTDILPDQHQSATLNSNRLPDTVVLQVRQTTFNEQGERDYTLVADRAEHYVDAEKAIFTKPSISFYDQNQIEWTATAQRGETMENGAILTLNGQVEISKQHNSQNPVSFSTEAITIQTRVQKAETDKKVILKQNEHRTEAKGLIIDMAAGKIKLLSQVKSYYDPNKIH